MFKKILIVLMIGCFLLGMATRAEAENVKEEAEEEVMSDSTTADFGTTTTESESNSKTHYQISAATVSKLALGDTITNMIFGETEMLVSDARALGVKGLEQRRADEKIRVRYPKVVMVSDKETIKKYKEALIESIKFFDSSGKLKKEIPVQKYIPKKRSPGSVGISDNEKYLWINTPTKEDKGISRVSTVVFDSDGKRLWGFEHNSASMYLSPNGEYIVGFPDLECGECPILVYNKNGKILEEIGKDDQSYDIAFSKDGSYFAVRVIKIDWEMETNIHINRQSADLLVIDDQGNELWRKEKIAKGDASFGEVKISNDTIIFMTGFGEFKIYYFDKNGGLLKTEQGDIKRAKEFKN
jgi:hypothetical protein